MTFLSAYEIQRGVLVFDLTKIQQLVNANTSTKTASRIKSTAISNLNIYFLENTKMFSANWSPLRETLNELKTKLTSSRVNIMPRVLPLRM